MSPNIPTAGALTGNGNNVSVTETLAIFCVPSYSSQRDETIQLAWRKSITMEDGHETQGLYFSSAGETVLAVLFVSWDCSDR